MYDWIHKKHIRMTHYTRIITFPYNIQVGNGIKITSKWHKFTQIGVLKYSKLPSYGSHYFVGTWFSHVHFDSKAFMGKDAALENKFSTLYYVFQ